MAAIAAGYGPLVHPVALHPWRRAGPTGRRDQMIGHEDIDGVAVVRLAHGKVNALDLDLLKAITETFAELDSSTHRAIVLTGSGRALSAGVDLWRVIEGGPDYVRAFLPALSDAFLAVFRAGKPVIAAVNGHAIAGGAILAWACDHRMMADAAGRIGVTELHVGVPFPLAALEIVRSALGEVRARGAVITAATCQPGDALANGYVDELVAPEDLLDAAVAIAVRLATAIPADTYRLTKAQLQQPVEERLARLRPTYDPRTTDLWIRSVNDGRLRRYMEQVTRAR
jgi:enoyl-CoA hydratase